MSPMDKIKTIIVMIVKSSKIQNSISFKILDSKLKKRISSERCYWIIVSIQKSVIIIGCTVSNTSQPRLLARVENSQMVKLMVKLWLLITINCYIVIVMIIPYNYNVWLWLYGNQPSCPKNNGYFQLCF